MSVIILFMFIFDELLQMDDAEIEDYEKEAHAALDRLLAAKRILHHF